MTALDSARAGRDHAVVVGAGLAGLTAARVLAARFARATVVDRDALPATPRARPGGPQARHAHILLARGQRAYETLFPGIDAELAAAGAPRVDWTAPGGRARRPVRPRRRLRPRRRRARLPRAGVARRPGVRRAPGGDRHLVLGLRQPHLRRAGRPARSRAPVPGLRFQRALARTGRPPWALSTSEDFRYPTTESGRPGPATGLLHRYLDGVLLASTDRPAAHLAFSVTHLLAPPVALLRPAVALPALAALRRAPRRLPVPA